MKRVIIGTCCMALAIGTGWVIAQDTLPSNKAAQAPAESTLAARYSYAIGLDMGASFRTRTMELDVEHLAAGLRDGLSGAEPKFDRATCGQALQHLQVMMGNKAMAQAQAEGAKNKQLGDAFLAKNKAQPGIQVTKSGLQYKVIEPGTGATPTLRDTVRCNYRGTLIDGTEFDASARHGGPAEFPVGGVIPGWTEALQLMKVGAKWQLYIPAELAYGNDPPGPPIEAGSVLVFDIELLGIVGQ